MMYVEKSNYLSIFSIQSATAPVLPSSLITYADIIMTTIKIALNFEFIHRILKIHQTFLLRKLKMPYPILIQHH